MPHALYIQNYSSAAATCILLKKWIFCLRREINLSRKDPWAHTMLFWEAIDDVNKGQVKAGAKLYQLKALQDVRRIDEVEKKEKLFFIILSVYFVYIGFEAYF